MGEHFSPVGETSMKLTHYAKKNLSNPFFESITQDAAEPQFKDIYQNQIVPPMITSHIDSKAFPNLLGLDPVYLARSKNTSWSKF